MLIAPGDPNLANRPSGEDTRRISTRRIESIQAARGIAALMVVVCHTSAFIGEDPNLWQRKPIYLWLRGTALGVQLFFVLSGVVIFHAHRLDFDRPNRIAGFYWKRFRRIDRKSVV